MYKPKVHQTSTEKLRFIMGCGGSGGHIIPGIALARELVVHGHEILFIGNSQGMEERIVAENSFSFRCIKVQKLYRKISLDNLIFPYKLAWSSIKTIGIMREFKPNAVVCTGGFVSGPVALAAIILGIPLYFHESNSYPGLTTRLLARYTNITFISFAGSAKHIHRATLVNLGIPIPARQARNDGFQLADIGLDPSQPVILITGGSQGSLAINAAVDAILPALVEKGYQLIWQTGKTGFAEYSSRHAAQKGVHIFDFSPYLLDYYCVARLAVTRAGAMTVAELEENRLPAVMIPLPTAAENHQYHNAVEQEKRGLAMLLKQSELSPESLLSAIENMMSNHASYQAKLQELPPNTASRDIVQAILDNLDQEVFHAGKN